MKYKKKITLAYPDDCHLHVRDGDILKAVLPHSVRQFGRAIIMPNLIPPITTTDQAIAYRQRIISALPVESKFEPLMTLYLTENTKVSEIKRAIDSGYIYGVKFYPLSITTNTDNGIYKISKCNLVLNAMEKYNLPLLVHGEINDPSIDIFDREKIFIDKVLIPMRKQWYNLKIVLEHITTYQAVQYITEATGAPIGATITAHHLRYNRNIMFLNGFSPHYYCLPVLKREVHRKALINAVKSGNERFFLGTDSAPHIKRLKENNYGYAGCYTALHALELYAQVFDEINALPNFEKFASVYGANFYGLPKNTEKISLIHKTWQIPKTFEINNKQFIVPLGAGEKVHWSLL